MLVKLLVVGSINMDVVNRVRQHPRPGETVHGSGTGYFPGGKGANQAVAAARAGARVTMLGAVGNDPFADTLVSTLRQYGVNTDRMMRKPTHSGMAFITVDETGENCIVLSAGANQALEPGDIDVDAIRDSDVVLLQNEISWETNLYVMRQAARFQTPVWLNPAPAMRVRRDILPLIDTLIVNESEAAVMCDTETNDPIRLQEGLKQLLDHGSQRVVLTLGRNGSVCMQAGREPLHIRAFEVQSVDTTSAGDTFIGALAAACGTQRPAGEQLRFAAAAAAITVTRTGAQQSIPDRQEVIRFLEERGLLP